MAQISAGIKFEYGSPNAGSEPTLWTEIPDVQSIPTLIGDPNSLDATKLTDTQKTYVPGLPDNGGLLTFAVYLTPEVFDAYDAVNLAQATEDLYYRVTYPAPLNKAFQWRGRTASLSNQDTEPDSVVMGNWNVVPSTIIEIKDVEA